MVAFLFAQPFAPPPKRFTPPKEGYLHHPPPERLQKEARSQRLRMIPVTFMHPPARHSSRLGQRFQLALGAAAALAAISLSPGSAQAYVVTVGGVQYDVTTFTGTYNANASKFALPANGGVMPWWGNRSLVEEFANAVAGGLGYESGLGPAFAIQYAYADNTYFTLWAPQSCGSGCGEYDFIFQNVEPSSVYRWAQVAPTLYTAPAPGPLPLFGAAAAFGFSRKLRKRIKLAPAALGSSRPQA